MNSRSRLLLVPVLLVALAAALLGGPAVATAGPTKGTGGWYWPTGTEKLGSMSGYWKYRASNHSWHMAKDIAASRGHAVYAIADGVVAESKSGAGYGGVLVVWHRSGDGQKFLAVYGHITRKNLKKGAKIKAGQVIGTINSEGHVHFGIHPGDAYPPDRNPFRGHTYDSSQTYGWVDPIKFLKTHPADLPYTAPPLPLAATISTLSTPTVLGVAEGIVYWRLPADKSETVFARPLASGATSQLAEDAVLPALDTSSYLASTTASAFRLYDRRPVLTATYSTVEPAWKQPVTIAGTLANCAGKPFSGATVLLKRVNGDGSCVTVGRAISGPAGTYSLNFTPSRSYALRVEFKPPCTFLATSTAGVKVAPRPGLHAPNSTKQAKAAAAVAVSGKLDVRHSVGAHSVTLRFQQLTAAGWTDALSTWAVNANSAKGATRYSRQVTLAPGKWRVSASCTPDSLHAGQVTGWATFTVR